VKLFLILSDWEFLCWMLEDEIIKEVNRYNKVSDYYSTIHLAQPKCC